jgi:hypothetical protein
LNLAREQLRQGGEAPGAWIDEGLRIALHKDGCRLLEQLLQDPDLGIQGDELRSGEKCHPDRRKEIQTVLGTVRLQRSYFYRAGSGPGKQGQGRFPLDQALGLIDGYSAGMAKMMCRAGAMASGYEAASADLKAYAGLEVEGRQIQRMVNLKAAEDSGTKDAPVVFQNYQGEKPVISGGVRLEKLDWQPYTNGIFQAQVPADLQTGEVFVNGERQILARYPDFDPKAQYFDGYAADAISPQRVARWADPAGARREFLEDRGLPRSKGDGCSVDSVKIYLTYANRIDTIHRDGFCYRPARCPPHSVAGGPWRDGKGDEVREAAKAACGHGIKLGVYLSPADLFQLRTNPKYPGGYYGDGSSKVLSVIPSREPDVRWVGNENGVGRTTEWSVILSSPPDTSAFVDQGQRDLGSRAKLTPGSYLWWYPAEVNTTIINGWFWAANKRPKSAARLIDVFYQSVGCNGNMLLNLSPDNRRLIPDNQLAVLSRMAQVGAAVGSTQVCHRVVCENRKLTLAMRSICRC